MHISLSSESVDLAEYKSYIELTNRVCYYDEPNGNSVRLLNDEAALSKAGTLVDMPVYAKYTVNSKGQPTFKGHEVSIDADGDIVFNTTPIGVHTEVYIQDDDVETYSGKIATLPCLFAKQKIWKRNKNAVAAVKRLYEEGNLHNSWEIMTSKYEYQDGVKDLIEYSFEGNCLLGETSAPAYGESAKVLSLSATSSEILVAEALSKDLLEASEKREGSEETEMLNEEKVVVVEEIKITEPAQVIETEKAPEDCADVIETTEEIEKAALTDNDIRRAIYKLINETSDSWAETLMIFPEQTEVWFRTWDEKETDFKRCFYTIENDFVSISEPESVVLQVSPRQINSALDEKNSALIESNNKIQELENEISTLSPYKEAAEKAACEQAEAEKQEKIAELRDYVKKSNVFTKEELESEDISALISEMKATELKSMIADRIVGKQTATKETSSAKSQEKKEKIDIDFSEDTRSPVDIFKKVVFGQ